MFAIALWDRRERRLLLARDRFGIKPLYYATGDGRVLAFASVLRSLSRAPGFRGELDLDAVEAFLAFNSIPAPLSIWRGVHKLAPGHLLALDPRQRAGRAPLGAPRAGGQRRGPAASAGASSPPSCASACATASRRTWSPTFRSGCSCRAGSIRRCSQRLPRRIGSTRLSTFSIGFAEPSFTELDLARQVATRYGTDHHELVVSPPHRPSCRPKLVAAFDEPFADSSAVPTFLVSPARGGAREGRPLRRRGRRAVRRLRRRRQPARAACGTCGGTARSSSA